MKNIVFTFLKTIVSAIILYYLLFYSINIEEFLLQVQKLSWKDFAIACIAFCVTVFIGGWRWQIFTRPYFKSSAIRLSALYFIGYFFNNFLPSGVGGDFARAIIIGKEQNSMSTGFSTVIAERTAGFLATLTASFLALPFLPFRPFIFCASLISNAIFWGGVIIFFMVDIPKILSRLKWLPQKQTQKAINLISKLQDYKKNKSILIKGFLASLVYQTSIIFVVIVIGWLADIKFPLAAYFATVPLVWVISLLPISLNALGVREAGFAFLFPFYGASRSDGMFVSLIFFGTSIVASIIGGIIFVLWGSIRKKGTDFNSTGF